MLLLSLLLQFQQQLNTLMQQILQTAPNFVRCVKPNADKQPGVFDSKLVLMQLKYSGLFEAIRCGGRGRQMQHSCLSMSLCCLRQCTVRVF